MTVAGFSRVVVDWQSDRPPMDAKQRQRQRDRYDVRWENTALWPQPKRDISGAVRPVFAVVGDGLLDRSSRRSLLMLQAAIDREGYRWGFARWDVAYVDLQVSGNANVDEHRKAHRPLIEALHAADTTRVLMLGAPVLSHFRPDLKLAHVRGRRFVWGGTHSALTGVKGNWMVAATWSPKAVMRDPGIEGTWRRDVEWWCRVVGEGQGLDEVGREQMCVEKGCEIEASEWDRDFAGYCTKHWKKGKNQTWKAEEEWTRKMVKAENLKRQGSMF